MLVILRAALARGLVRNAALLLGGEAIARSLSIATLAVLARLLGPAEIGILAIAQALTTVAVVVAGGAIATLAQREVAVAASSATRIATAATVAQLALALIASTLILIGAALLPLPDGTLPVVLALLPSIVAQALSLTWVLQATERMGAAAAIKVSVQLVWTLVGIWVVLLTGSVVWYAGVVSVGVVIGAALSLGVLLRGGVLGRPRFDSAVLKSLASGAAPYLATLVITQAFLLLDVLFLGMVRSAPEVGHYSAAVRLVLFLITLSGVIGQAAFPQLSRRAATDAIAFSALASALVRLTATVALPAAAFLLVEANPVVRLLYGAEFGDSASSLAVLALWIPLGFLNTVCALTLVAAQRQRTYLGVVLVGAVVMLATLVVLVPSTGGAGAAWSVVLREAVMAAVFGVVIARRIRVRVDLELVRRAAWFGVPLLATITTRWLIPDAPLVATAAVWLLSVGAVEWAAGWPLYQQLVGRSDG